MEKGLDKLLRKLVLKKYPMYLDVHVVAGSNSHPYAHMRDCFEVFLILFEEDSDEGRISDAKHSEVRDYINNLGKYMDSKICGVYNEFVNEEDWEEMKLDKKD